LLVFSVFVGVATALSGSTARAGIYVSTGGDGTTGADWDHAYTNIQQALNVAVSNDIIYVAGKTYVRTNQLVWTQSYVRILGGYAATNAAEKPGPFNRTLWSTVITRNAAYNTRLLYVSGVKNGEIARITFTGGYPSAPTDVSGGGAMVVTGAVNLLMRDCILTNNYIYGSYPNNCYGGALHVLNSSGMISNTVFGANEAHAQVGTGYGGGLNISGGAVHLRDIVVLANRSMGEWASENWRCGYGGGISFHGGSHTITNALLFLNQSRRHATLTATEGSGIYVWNSAVVKINNATVYGHSSDGLYVASGNVTVRNCILARNSPDIGGVSASVAHSLVRDGTGGGTTNILTGEPGLDDEWFYLAADSPCRNTGNGTVGAARLTGYTVSTNGAAEATGATVSMGYHYPPGTSVGPLSEFYVSYAGGNDGQSGDADHPFKTIPRALQAATGRIRVHLLPGTYDTATGFPVRIAHRGSVQIAGTDPQTTFIDGKNAANKRLFEFFCAYGNNRISGVTLRNAGGTVASFDGIQAGGAIHISRGRLTIENCSITNNRATVGAGAIGLGIHTIGGGAIGAKQAALDIRDTLFAGNKSTSGSSGGAILAHATVGIFLNCTFSGNMVDALTGPNGHNRSVTGGALHLARSSLDIYNCLFTGNKAISHRSGESAGGAIFQCDGRVALRNCVFANNLLTNNYTVMPLRGAAAYQHDPGYLSGARTALDIDSTTIACNRGDDGSYGYGLCAVDTYTRVDNSILWNNHPADFTNLSPAVFFYSRADNLIPGANSNITDDPLLIDPAGGNCGLQTSVRQYTSTNGTTASYGGNSPCIDIGYNLAWMAGETDIRGLPRMSCGRFGKTLLRVDMGACEVMVPRAGMTILVQ